MSREEIQKLLGGYATDTLSEAERRALFEAALEDQELFDALAQEQALRDVLEEPAARQHLIEALAPPVREPFAARAWHWLRQPAALAMVAGAAGLLIVAGLVLRQTRHPPHDEVIVADAIAPRSAPPLEPIEPPAVAGKPKPPARLAARRAVPAPQAMASPEPPPPPAAPAAPSPAKRQLLQATPEPAQTIIAQESAPTVAMFHAKGAAPVPAKVTVQYTLLPKGADGAYAPVPPGTVFHIGDSVRLQVDPSESGYISLFQRNADAGWDLIASQSVEKGQRYELPPAGLQSDTPARLELLLVVSRVEPVDVDALASQAQASSRITIEFR